MNKLIILILCLFSFLPFVNAEDYSNYEVVEVEELPTACADTLNKVFKVNGVYYVTELQEINYTAILLNENLKGKTIYFNFNDEFFNDTKCQFVGYYQLYDINNQSYTFYIFFSDDYLNGRINNSAFIQQGSAQFINKFSYTFPTDKDYIITKLYDNDFTESNYFSNISLTPFEVTYSWKIVSSYELGTFDIPDQDFYLFFDFDTIKDFDIFSSFNFDSFTDYEKLNITLLLNIFFGLFIFLIIYISLKAIYKFASMII